MGQPEVYDFLKANRTTWYTAKDISEMTGLSAGSVSVAMKSLRKSDLVEFKQIRTEGYLGAKRGTYAYKYKDELQTKLLLYF